MKLSRIDKQKIRDAHGDGLTQQELALLFGVSQSTISNILKDKSLKKEDQIADRMERFLGGSVVDDGCYVNGEHKTPDAYVDYNDPLTILIAEETLDVKHKT